MVLAKLGQWECTRHGDAIWQPSQLEHGACLGGETIGKMGCVWTPPGLGA